MLCSAGITHEPMDGTAFRNNLINGIRHALFARDVCFESDELVRISSGYILKLFAGVADIDGVNGRCSVG